MTSKTRAVREYGRRAFLNVGACPYGREKCDGVSGLYFGQLSCFDCWVDASTDAQATMAGVGV